MARLMAAAVTASTMTGSMGTDTRSGSLAVSADTGRRAPADLRVLDEPVELLAELRAAARDRPAVAREDAPALLALYAADAWEDQLEVFGLPLSLVTHAFETCRREIWLWVDGDRRWQQLAGHLAQRVVRRAGSEGWL
jgi:hypothetical protein